MVEEREEEEEDSPPNPTIILFPNPLITSLSKQRYRPVPPYVYLCYQVGKVGGGGAPMLERCYCSLVSGWLEDCFPLSFCLFPPHFN